MKAKIITVLFSFLIPIVGFTQTQSQYFDGADSSAYSSIFVNIDTSASNIWQIGPPQKAIFNNAATQPNVIVTDTIDYYPTNDSSSFSFDLNPDGFGWGIIAIQWKQKLDMDHDFDGGVIEYTIDGGSTWQNVFNDPYVYNFYGYDQANVDTLPNGEYAFSGTDTTWRDLWLCFDVSWLFNVDVVTYRFTLKSDSIDNNKEGWMIDNLLTHLTIIHTIVEEVEQEEYIKVFPNPTSGRVEILAQKTDGYHIIEKMELFNVEGKVMEEFGRSPTKFSIDLSKHPDGVYFLKIKTNLKTETVRIILQK